MTAQIYEQLIIDGECYGLAAIPGIPEIPGRVDKNPESEKAPWICHSTACWRGYVGTWKIEDDKLFLVDVIGNLKKLDPEPIFAEWVTDRLRIDEGETLNYVHMGFGSTSEIERHIFVNNGCIVHETVVNNLEIRTKALEELAEILDQQRKRLRRFGPSIVELFWYLWIKIREPRANAVRKFLVRRCEKQIRKKDPELLDRLKGMWISDAIEEIEDAKATN